MRKLLLMRHAKAVREAGLSDHARRLTDRGRADAALIAGFLHDNSLSPDLAFASDSARTRETLEIALGSFGNKPAARLDPNLYLAEPLQILKTVRVAPASVTTLMVIGHNPGIAELALALTGRGAPADVRRLAASFPTSAVAVLAFDAVWSEVAEPGGRLERFVVAKTLRETANGEERA